MVVVVVMVVWFISLVPTRPFAERTQGRGRGALFRLGKGGSEGLHAGVKWYVEGGAAAEAVQDWRSGMGRSPQSG